MTHPTPARTSSGERRRPSDGRSGVVLMETILVLPLLLALLGGLFVVGELAMGRLVSQEMDRALAWRAADRFGPTDFDADAFSHVVGAHGITQRPGLHAFEATGSGMGNKWSSVFAGRSDVEVEVPWWINFVNAHDDVRGDPKHPNRLESRFKLTSTDEQFDQAARTYVFRRRDDSDDKGNAYWRGKPTEALRWLDIVGDKMAGKTVSSESGGRTPAYRRSALAIAVSGDPGP